MKHRLLLYAAVMHTVAIAASAGAQVEWLETKHNFGAFSEDEGVVECVFRYVNTGDTTLQIKAARTSCGCTLPHYSREPLAPGDTASVTVSYDPTGRPGRFSKNVYIDMDTEPVRNALTISGVVIGAPTTVSQRYPVAFGSAMRMSRGAVLAGDVAYGRLKTVFLEVYNASTDTIRPVAVRTPRFMDATWMPEAIAPGEQSSLVCHFRSADAGNWGLVTDSITISPYAESTERYTLPATIIVSEDFSKLNDDQRAKAPAITVDTERLDFGNLSGGVPVTLTARIGNRGRSPLEIRRVYTTDDGITATIERTKIKPGKHAELHITVDPSKICGNLLNSKINIICNDPTRPNHAVRAVGEAKQTIR